MRQNLQIRRYESEKTDIQLRVVGSNMDCLLPVLCDFHRANALAGTESHHYTHHDINAVVHHQRCAQHSVEFQDFEFESKAEAHITHCIHHNHSREHIYWQNTINTLYICLTQ